MDLDGGLICKVVVSTEDFDKAVQMGVTTNLLAGPGREAWRFLSAYRDRHNSLPGISLVEEKLGTKFRDLDAGLPWIVDEIRKRDLFKAIQGGIEGATSKLEKRDPDAALKLLEELVDDSRVKKQVDVSVKALSDVGDEVIEQYLRTKNGEIGIPFPWPTMSEMCVIGESEICDPFTGKLVRMDEFCNSDSEFVYGWGIKDGIKTRKITFKGKTGHKECLKITTSLGKNLIGTHEHPVLTPVGWKRLDELRPGDSVAIAAKYDEPVFAKEIPEEHVIILAALLTDGCITGRKVCVAKKDEGFLDAIRCAVEKMGCELRYDRRANYYITCNNSRKRDDKGCFTNEIIHPVWKMLDGYNVVRARANAKEIPDVIMALPNRQLAQFIGMFWSGDGSVNDCGGNTAVGIGLTSKKMILQLRSLLLRFGVVTSFYEREQCEKNWNKMYILRVVTEFHDRFFDAFGEFLVGKRYRDGVRLISECTENSIKIGNVVDIGELKGVFRQIFDDSKWTIKSVAEQVGRNAESFNSLFIRIRDGAERISSSRIQIAVLKEFLKQPEMCKYSWIVNDDIYWVQVKSIDDAGCMDVYDMTVPGSHSFVTNDFVVHNTMGLWPGTLTFFAARPGSGKTFCIVMIALYGWMKGHRVLIVSPEMSSAELAERAYAIRFRVPYRGVIGGSLGVFVESDFFKGIRSLKETDGFFIIDESEDMTPERIEQAIDAVNPDLIGIDSVYMIRTARGNRYERMLTTVDWLRELAKRKDKPVVALSQFNRDKGGNAMSNFAMTDTIAWDAHNLFGLKQDEDMREIKQMEFEAIKVRRQAFQKNVRVSWNFDTMEFTEIGVESVFQDEDFDLDPPF